MTEKQQAEINNFITLCDKVISKQVDFIISQLD